MIPLPIFVELTLDDGPTKTWMRSDYIIRIDEVRGTANSSVKSKIFWLNGDKLETLLIRETREQFWVKVKEALEKAVDESVADTPKSRKQFADAMDLFPSIYDLYASRRHYENTEDWFERMDSLMKKMADVFDQPFVPQKKDKESWES